MEKRGKKFPVAYYIMAGSLGVAFFIVALYSFKALVWVLKAVLKYWIIIIAVIIGALILKKILFRRKIKRADFNRQV